MSSDDRFGLDHDEGFSPSQPDRGKVQKGRPFRLKRAWGRSRFRIASCCRSAGFSRAASVRFLNPDCKSENNKNSASIMIQNPACG